MPVLNIRPITSTSCSELLRFGLAEPRSGLATAKVVSRVLASPKSQSHLTAIKGYFNRSPHLRGHFQDDILDLSDPNSQLADTSTLGF